MLIFWKGSREVRIDMFDIIGYLMGLRKGRTQSQADISEADSSENTTEASDSADQEQSEADN